MKKNDGGVDNNNLNKGESCIKNFTNEELDIIKLFRLVKDPALKKSVKSIIRFVATASSSQKETK